VTDSRKTETNCTKRAGVQRQVQSFRFYERISSSGGTLYRYSIHICLDFCCDLSDELQHPTQRSHALPVSLQMRIINLVSGTFTMLACLWLQGALSTEFASRIDEHVYFYRDLQQVKTKFYENTQFPRVIGSDVTNCRINRCNKL
jgi:hypothetical protein